MQISIRKTKTFALIDTGASISCVSQSFLSKTDLANSKLESPDFSFIKGVSGQKLRVLGKIVLPISFSGQVFEFPVHVIENLHHSFILGVDFMQTNKVVISFATNTLCINNDSARPIVCSIETNAGYARASKSFKIPSNSETLLEIKVSRRKTNDVVLLEPSNNLSSLQLSAAKSLVHIKNLRGYLKVLNPTDKDISIPQNKVLAVVSEVDQKSIDHFDAEISEIQTSQTNSEASEDISFDLASSKLNQKQRVELKKFLESNRDIFAKDLSELGETNVYEHNIDTHPDARPVRMPFYRANPNLQEEIRKHVDDMLENDIIEPSNSIWHSPVVMVKKRSGEWRFAVDYRKLNKITVPLSFPLPHLETVFDAIGHAKPRYFSSLDLRSGFWQIKMSEKSKHKAAFITQEGIYEWKRMPYECPNFLSNSNDSCLTRSEFQVMSSLCR